MRALVVVSVDLPEPEAVASVLKAIDLPKVPHFDGQVRIVVEPHASQVVEWLDGDEL